MPKAAEVINYLQNEGTLAMAHLEGPDVGLKLCPKGQQQRLLSEKPRASEFTGNYDLLCQWQVIPSMWVTPTSKDRSLRHHCLLRPISRRSIAQHIKPEKGTTHLIQFWSKNKETHDNIAYPKKALVTCELI